MVHGNCLSLPIGSDDSEEGDATSGGAAATAESEAKDSGQSPAQ